MAGKPGETYTHPSSGSRKMRSRSEINQFVRSEVPANVDMVTRAIKFAEFAHDGQTDKGGHRYMEHVGFVGRETAKRYCDDNLTAAAYLHDVVEDGGFTISDLAAWFPPVVWKIVQILTRKKSEDRELYIGRVAENLLAAKVKIVDLDNNMDLSRIPNLRAADRERQDRYATERSIIFDALIQMERRLAEKEQQSEVYAELYM